MKTRFGVDKLTKCMIRKYGLVDAMTLLRQQYSYTIEDRRDYVVFTDNHPMSKFRGNKYTYKKGK